MSMDNQFHKNDIIVYTDESRPCSKLLILLNMNLGDLFMVKELRDHGSLICLAHHRTYWLDPSCFKLIARKTKFGYIVYETAKV
jgi:hypothetical protein